MDVLVSLAPVALIVLVCGGMHFFMMRGMHGGHGAGREGHSGLRNEDSPDRVAQLESQVKRLQQEIQASQRNDASAGNGHHRETVLARHYQDETPVNDPGRGYN